MGRLVVEVSADRDRCGSIRLIDAAGRKLAGPFPVAARSTDSLAASNGNSNRNPLFRYGDTPTGTYLVRHVVKSGPRTKYRESRFGPHGLIVLDPVSGEAACAEANGRFHFMIVGGDLSEKNQLRSTAGSLRLRNDDLRRLLGALKHISNVRCEIVERDGVSNRGRVAVDPACEDADPLESAISTAGSAGARRARESLLVPTAMALTFVVSFVALREGGEAQASAPPVLRSAPVNRDDALTSLPPRVLDNQYVRLAYNGPAATSSNFDKTGFVQYMDAHAQGTGAYSGTCASACRDALDQGGHLDIAGHPRSAGDYGPFLMSHGFAVVPKDQYVAQPGDIAVFNKNDLHPDGHIQAWDGNQWVSDTHQPRFLPNRNYAPIPYTVYRHP